MKIDINEGSYSYSVVLNDWICEAELFSHGDTIIECLNEIFNNDFLKLNTVETITITNYMNNKE